MIVERAPGTGSFIDVLDRVLDKGIVIDAWLRVSLVGIDLITQARVVVASIETYLKYSDCFARPVPSTTTVKQIAAGLQLHLSDRVPASSDLVPRMGRVSRRRRGSS